MWRERGKKERNFGRSGLGGPAEGGPNQRTTTNKRQQTTTTTHNTQLHKEVKNNTEHQPTPKPTTTQQHKKMDWPKLVGQTRWPKMDWPKLDWPKSAATGRWCPETTAKTDFGQTNLGQTEFDLLCVVLCCVLSVGRGYLFHGVRVGFHVWVLVSRFGLDRPSPGPPRPPPFGPPLGPTLQAPTLRAHWVAPGLHFKKPNN